MKLEIDCFYEFTDIYETDYEGILTSIEGEQLVFDLTDGSDVEKDRGEIIKMELIRNE